METNFALTVFNAKLFNFSKLKILKPKSCDFLRAKEHRAVRFPRFY